MTSERFGPYDLLRCLGRGGMAEVFLARAASAAGDAKLVALKRLIPGYAQDRHLVDLLVDEARISVQLDHPNIVHVFDFLEVEGSYGLVMEYVPGVDLRALVPSDGASGPLPLDVALRVAICLLDALDHAHGRCGADGQPLGIVHRDVTPHNVLVSHHGQAKLTDFGVARARISSHLSSVGDIRGKFSYMPPEQAVGGQIDQRVDIFAAGAVLYELATGQQPFRAGDSARQLFLLDRGVPPPSQLNPALPRALDAITLQAMDPKPENRFACARDFAQQLRELMGQRFSADLGASVHRLADLVERVLGERGQVQAEGGAELMKRDDFCASAPFSLIAPGVRVEQGTRGEGTQAAPGMAPAASPAATGVDAEPPAVGVDALFSADAPSVSELAAKRSGEDTDD